MKLRLLALALLLLIAGWLWWNWPRQADMAAYVPAESLAFLETNDLAGVFDGITNTEAWKTLSGPAGATFDLGKNRWLMRLARWTGVGPAEAVVLGRAQFAVTVTQLEAGDGGLALRIKPVAALVIETHTTQFRMHAVVEKRIDDLAHRMFGNPQLQHKSIEGVDFTEWLAPDGVRRIVSALVGTAVIVGNDEAPVQACAAVRRGAKPSLADNKLVQDMRNRLEAPSSPLFGFVSSDGLKSLLIAEAPYWSAGAGTTNLPVILANAAAKLVDGAAWAPRFADGAVEDRYSIALANGVAQQLRDGVVPEHPAPLRFTDLLPPETYSFTQYDFRDLETAWRGLNTAVSAHVDAFSAMAATQMVGLMIKSYGIDDPTVFFRAIGPHIATVRLDDDSGTVLIAEVLDAQTLHTIAAHRLGPNPKTETIGDAQILVSSDPAHGAASFTGNQLLMGSAEDVRRCLAARTQAKSLATTEAFRPAEILLNPSAQRSAVTFTNDELAARSFVLLFSANRNTTLSPQIAAINTAVKRLPYTARVTELTENGFEQTTRSSFGLLGALIVQFASGAGN